jgi:flagellar basal-body rod protein FlgC
MLINRYFSVFRTAARGLEAQRIAMGAASENIANATTTRTADGTPYALKRAVQTAPAEGPTRFQDLMSQAQGALHTTDPRHLTGASLTPQARDVELGPETEVQEDVRLRLEYDPTHPHADASGYVAYPDVNVVEEMARMVSANRVYEANLSAVQAAKEMIKRTLEV